MWKYVASRFELTLCFFAFIIVLLAACSPADQTAQNRLSKSSSPYLQEHADNPVNWYEWGDEALDKAKAENKPLLISIGYAACHWCHQMEQESFMDTAVARLMNENFICIKVDREQRPDIDNLYMHACQLLNNGQAGWPLNVFALPDGKPFFAGTYYAKENWQALLVQVSEMYRTKHNKVVMQANSLTFGIIDNDSLLLVPGKVNTPSLAVYKKSFENVYPQVDLVNGGLKGQPKFPAPSLWEFLLQYYYFTSNKQALDAATITLEKMALGGLYDQVGGGFARYSTDSLWRVPHFEKMLCDNAQLISLYTHAYQLTKNDFFRNIVLETMGFVNRELTDANGGFYCSLNADTPDGEGTFYTWDHKAFSIFPGKNSKLLKAYYNINESAKIENGKYILHAAVQPSAFAALNKMETGQFEVILKDAKKQLLAERNKRKKPSVDDKILTSWNALMLQACVDVYAAFGNEAFLQSAKANAIFLEKNMMDGDGRLRRSFFKGKAADAAFLDDYSLLAKAFIRLYEVSFEKHWLLQAEKLTEYALANFYDNKSGFFFFTASAQDKLPVRKIELLNSVIPASNAVMAEVLYALSVLLGNEKYHEKATAMLVAMEGTIPQIVTSAPAWTLLAGVVQNKSFEVAIMGKDALQKNLELQKHYLPGCIFMGGSVEELPLLKDKLPANGTLIYVCTNKSCKRPVADVETALSQLQ